MPSLPVNVSPVGSETHFVSPSGGLYFLDPVHINHTQEIGVQNQNARLVPDKQKASAGQEQGALVMT